MLAEVNAIRAAAQESIRLRGTKPQLHIDFRQLSEQKIALIQMMNSPGVDEAQEAAIEGLLLLVEAIQDHAIEHDGIDEAEVFPFLEPI